MKPIIILLYAVILFMLAGCINDMGNYDYLDPETITPNIVSGVENSYSAISMEKLTIDPVIKGDESKYEYVWYAFLKTQVTQAVNDTLGTEKKLDYTVIMKPGRYTLVFKVTNKENGTAAYIQSELSVSSFFSQGYYILKYENGRTDVDFIDRNGMLHANILKTVNGEDLAGKPIRAAYEVNQYSYNVVNPDGSKTRIAMQPAYMVCTDEDLAIYEGTSIKLLKKWDEAFLELPAVKKPQGVWANTSGFMLMNNNTVCFVDNNGTNTGEFGYPYPNNGMKLNARVAVSNGNLLCYDDNAGELVGYYARTYYPVKDAVAVASPMTLKPVGETYFTNSDLLFMGVQQHYGTTAGRTYVIVKDRTTSAASLWQINTAGIQYGYIYDYGARSLVIPSSFDVVNGKVFAMQGYIVTAPGVAPTTPPALSAVIYYSKGDNAVHYYNPSNQTEKKDIITIPTDEQIVYLEHSSDSYFGVDIFNVLSMKGETWTLRTYKKIGYTPDINPAIINTYRGNGAAKNLIYRHPNSYITLN